MERSHDTEAIEAEERRTAGSDISVAGSPALASVIGNRAMGRLLSRGLLAGPRVRDPGLGAGGRVPETHSGGLDDRRSDHSPCPCQGHAGDDECAGCKAQRILANAVAARHGTLGPIADDTIPAPAQKLSSSAARSFDAAVPARAAARTEAGDAAMRTKMPGRATLSRDHRRRLMRYGHDVQTCTQEDLEKLLWPGDYLARQIVAKTIDVISRDPPPAYLPGVFKRYFMKETPDITKIKSNFATIQKKFVDNDYFYQCAHDCESSPTVKTMGKTKVSMLLGGSGPVILCMNNLKGQLLPVKLTAETIIHEFAHRYLNFSGDTYCEWDCGKLSPDSALTNPDSYSMLAGEIWFEEEIAALKAKKKAGQTGPTP